MQIPALGEEYFHAQGQAGNQLLGSSSTEKDLKLWMDTKVDPEPAKCPCSDEIQKYHQLHEEEPWQHVKGGDNSSLSALECLVQG